MLSVGFVGFEKNMKALNEFVKYCGYFDDKGVIEVFNVKFKDILDGKVGLEQFDIIVLGSCCKGNIILLKDLSKKSILIVNSDDKEIFSFLRGSTAKLITYGLGTKSCITASSIQDEGGYIMEVLLCIQRTLTTFSGFQIEPQEFRFSTKKNKISDIYIFLPVISVAIMSGLALKNN